MNQDGLTDVIQLQHADVITAGELLLNSDIAVGG